MIIYFPNLGEIYHHKNMFRFTFYFQSEATIEGLCIAS